MQDELLGGWVGNLLLDEDYSKKEEAEKQVGSPAVDDDVFVMVG